MDYGRTAAETGHLNRVDALVQEAGRQSDLLLVASAGGVLADLEDALADPVTAGAPRHERLLIVEEAARLGLPALPGLRLLVGAEVFTVDGEGGDPAAAPRPGPVAVLDRRRAGPARNATLARTAIVLDGPDGWVLDLTGRSVSRVESSFGYPYGRLPPDVLEDLPGGVLLSPAAVAAARIGWHLTLAAEIAGTASGALGHVTAYLRGRRQFGQPLSGFQALRHRVADLAVSTEAALWLTREAAWYGDAGRAGVAVSYARDLAAAMVPEVVQLSGARGFTTEFPAHLFAMRLEGLRLEVGSADRLARSLATGAERSPVRFG